MKFVILLSFSLLVVGLYAQDVEYSSSDFYLYGDATMRDDTTMMLTDNLLQQSGSMWYRDDIDLNEPFHVELDLFFGCSDGGADGITFILHPELSLGSRGEGMGFGGLTPSFCVEMDTYQNFHLKDAHFDHAAFMANGISHHRLGLTEPIPLGPKKENVENCTFYTVVFDWNPKSQIFTFTFNGIERIRRQIDLISLIFRGNSNVFWGLGAATAQKRNKQLVRVRKLEFSPNETLDIKDQITLLKGDSYIIDQIDFKTGSAELPESAKPILDKLIRFQSDHPKFSFILDSFLDTKDKEMDDSGLAKDRINTIARYMIANGIPKDKVIYYGTPQVSELELDSVEERQKPKRRIEIQMKIVRV